jgi:hypothetical protein
MHNAGKMRPMNFFLKTLRIFPTVLTILMPDRSISKEREGSFRDTSQNARLEKVLPGSISEGMKQADPNVTWPKLKVVKSVVAVTSEMPHKVLLPPIVILPPSG